jgi:hypothetical protein
MVRAEIGSLELTPHADPHTERLLVVVVEQSANPPGEVNDINGNGLGYGRQLAVESRCGKVLSAGVDISTTGGRTGRIRPIGIWLYRVDDEVYLTAPAAARSWYSGLLANSQSTVRFKSSIHADLAARVEPVPNLDVRRHIPAAIIFDLNKPLHRGYISQPAEPIARWVDGSPLMHVTFD